MGEIEEQPYGLFEEAKISEQLADMRCVQSFYSLDFQNQPIVNQNIKPKRGVEFLSVYFDRNGMLPYDAKAAPLYPSCQDGFIDIFEKTGP